MRAICFHALPEHFVMSCFSFNVKSYFILGGSGRDAKELLLRGCSCATMLVACTAEATSCRSSSVTEVTEESVIKKGTKIQKKHYFYLYPLHVVPRAVHLHSLSVARRRSRASSRSAGGRAMMPDCPARRLDPIHQR